MYNLATGTRPACTWQTYYGSQIITFPAEARNIRATLYQVITDDGRGTISVNGVLVLAPQPQHGYCESRCGQPVIIAGSDNWQGSLAITLRPGSNTISGNGIDTCGGYASLSVYITATYEAYACTAA